MFTNFVNRNIQETLKAKERALSRLENDPDSFKHNRSAVSYTDINSIASRTPFFRMISNKQNVKNIVISGGERNIDGTMKHGLVDGDKGIYYETRFKDNKGVVGPSQSGIRPIAGVKDVEISYSGDFKALRKATINWSVGSLEDLEVLTPYFLTVGKSVMIDWGWVLPSMSKDGELRYGSLNEQFGLLYFYRDENGNGKVNPEVFTDQQSKILDIGGNYGAMGGTISNFSYDLRSDGGFNCVTKVMAVGVSMFKKPINKGVSEKAIIGKKVEENKTKAIITPVDSLVTTILNLREYIVDSCFFPLQKSIVGGTADENKLVDFGDQYQPGSKFYNTKIAKALLGVPKNKPGAVFDPDKKKDGVLTLAEYNGKQAGLFTDATQNILWLAGDLESSLSGFSDSGEMWVSWGWFEDNVLNRYVSYVANNEVTMTIRSLETVLTAEEGGKPIPMPDKIEERAAAFRKAINEENSIDDLTQEGNYYGSYLKAPIEIGNHPFLKPKKSFDFLIPGQNPAIEEFWITNADGDHFGSPETLDFFEQIKDVMGFVPTKGEGEEQLKGNFSKAGTKAKHTRGYLRNIFINIKQIQKAFGIDAIKGIVLPKIPLLKTKREKPADFIKPPATIEAGVKALLRQLNNNYFGIWDFELTVDPYDSTNIQAIDKSISVETSGKGVLYSKFSENGKQSGTGIYKFPSYKLGSIVKSQTLSFKIPDNMAVTAMYGSNTAKVPVGDPSHNDSQINTQFALDKSPEYDDAYLNNMESTYREWGINADGFTGKKIGSKGSSVNSKIMEDIGNLEIRGEAAKWIPMTIAEQKVDPPKKSKSRQAVTIDSNFSGAIWHYDPIKKRIIDVRKYTDDFNNSEFSLKSDAKFGDLLAIPEDKGLWTTTPASTKKDTGYYILDTDTNSYVLTSKVVPIVSKVIKGTIDTEGREEFYRQDFIIPAELGLEIDGTEGLIPGNLIHTDYIPSKYNKNVVLKDKENTPGQPYGPFTYFQIFKLTHKIRPSGWTTEIGTKMRVNTELLQQDPDKISKFFASSGTLEKSIDTQPTNTNTLNNALENKAIDEIAVEESRETPEPIQEVASVEPDDYTDTELLTGAVNEEYWKAQTEETSTIATENASLYEAIQAKNKGINTQPPPLTGEGNDGNKVTSIDTGPDGEEIKTNSKGKSYYINSDGNAVIVKTKVSQAGNAVVIQKDPNPDEGLVIISDFFKYNLAGDVLIAEEDPVDEIPEEVLNASLDNLPDGLSMRAGALLVIQQKMKRELNR